MAILIAVSMMIVILSVEFVIQWRKERNAESSLYADGRVPSAMSWPPARIPSTAFVAADHTWARVESGETLRVGGDGLGAALLGPIRAVELASAGEELRRGDVMAVLKTEDRKVTLLSPIDGTITEVNRSIDHFLSTLRLDPFGRGWLYEITATGLAPALRGMSVGEEVSAWVHKELERLKGLLQTNAAPELGQTLADGGAPVEGVASQLPAESWKEVAGELFGPKDS